MPEPTDLQRKIVTALQGGLPLCRTPYAQVADDLGISEGELLSNMEAMRLSGAIRRIGVVPNHYALGYRFNLMVVWDVDEESVDEAGGRAGKLEFVSHCYRRPRKQDWPYNLFTMVHGKDNAEVEAKVAQIKTEIGTGYRSHTALKSTKILKKTGLRLRSREQ